ncbi:MAG: thiamine biosynthesis protein ApbE [Proteobacteria bacterium]|nr:thiamine biosynthesis protein ApbE [Pseudomonadota bacterium]
MNAPQLSLPTVRVLIPKQINPARARGEIRVLSSTCMGTTWSVRLVDGGVLPPPELTERIAALLECIENQMSHFRPDSDLRRFATLPAGEAQTLPAEFARVLRGALDVARLSEGAFDPALASLVDAWGFGAGPRFSQAGFVPPQTGALAEHTAGWKKLEIDTQDRLRQPGGVALNLAAIAKGFAVDAVSEHLAQSGYQNHLVEIGGELRGAGCKPDGQPWWVALELPRANCPLPATRIALHGLCVATSGDYRRSYRLNDRLIHHTLDPRSGMPAAHALSSVTVIHRECMYADAWATAIMVLGHKAGLELAEKMNLCALLQGQDDAGNWTEASSTAWTNLQQ